MVGVAAVLELADDAIEAARIATVGATDPPMRLPSVEGALANTPVAALRMTVGNGDESPLARAAEKATGDLDGVRRHGDAYASAEFRAAQLVPTVERAVVEAIGGDPS